MWSASIRSPWPTRIRTELAAADLELTVEREGRTMRLER